ncbi:MAG: alkaline phosphatase family protein, partial [Chthoniobacteraceae bacterium]
MKTRILSVLSVFAFCLPLTASAKPTKLIVTILVDQLRYDYLERFHDQFVERGFRLLMDDGAFLTFAHYNYAPTVTGPGHASFLSGAPPAMHGIISNDWFDKRTLKTVNCVSDPDVEGVGGSGEGKRSPRNFIGSNFADELRLRYHSKVVGISHKDRGAILPAGRKPTGAYWFDSASGNFMTSTYYMKELPAWVQEFNARKRPAAFIGQVWKRLLDPKLYEWPDDAAGEGTMPGEKKPTFDHTVRPSPTEGFETIVPTPFGNQLLAEFALAAIAGEHLGTGPQPDLLCVSFSSIDAAGHRFGPYSQEVQDMTLRLDRELQGLFEQLDKKFGMSNVMILLTADHGVAPTPEFAVEQGLDGQRNDTIALMGDLLAKLSGRFGDGRYLLTPRIVDGNIYFNHETLREKHLDPETVAGFIREWALSTGKFQAAYSRGQLLDGRAPGALGRQILNGYNAERSGDVVLVQKPFHISSGGKTGTTHGSPFSYDTHIPVLFYGSGFKPGRYADEFYITDIAPTLCAALHMNESAGNIGKPFVKLLTDEAPSEHTSVARPHAVSTKA